MGQHSRERGAQDACRGWDYPPLASGERVYLDMEDHSKRLWRIGDQVIDEDGNSGLVVIRWDDGDICEYENDAAHPNPMVDDRHAAIARNE